MQTVADYGVELNAIEERLESLSAQQKVGIIDKDVLVDEFSQLENKTQSILKRLGTVPESTLPHEIVHKVYQINTLLKSIRLRMMLDE